MSRFGRGCSRSTPPSWPATSAHDAAPAAESALPALTEALDGLGPARTKQRARVLADLAVNHRALGHDDQARELADEARAIGIERRSAKVLQRVRLAA